MKLGYLYAGKIVGDLNLGNDPYSGDPSSLTVPGDLTVTGDFTFGNAVVDTFVLNGRFATGSIAGAALDIDDTYTYDQLIEIRADVSDWTGIAGLFFYGMLMRISASVESASEFLYAQQIQCANGLPGETGVDIAQLSTFMFNTMGKGDSTITMMRGGEIKCEWAADDVVTDARGLQIEFMGLKDPSSIVYGLWFEKDSALGSMAEFIHEIRMKEGMVIMSRTSTPHTFVTAAKGSLCLVTDGSGAADRLWVSDGGTNWKYFTTEA